MLPGKRKPGLEPEVPDRTALAHRAQERGEPGRAGGRPPAPAAGVRERVALGRRGLHRGGAADDRREAGYARKGSGAGRHGLPEEGEMLGRSEGSARIRVRPAPGGGDATPAAWALGLADGSAAGRSSRRGGQVLPLQRSRGRRGWRGWHGRPACAGRSRRTSRRPKVSWAWTTTRSPGTGVGTTT